ncbi:MAG: hypothetical protein R3E42_18045 [Burkholderiaceae bacterium]
MASAYTVASGGVCKANQQLQVVSSGWRVADRPPMWCRMVLDAQLLVVNADNAQGLASVRYAELPGKVLLVGQNDDGTGWPLQRRPLKLVCRYWACWMNWWARASPRARR